MSATPSEVKCERYVCMYEEICRVVNARLTNLNENYLSEALCENGNDPILDCARVFSKNQMDISLFIPMKKSETYCVILTG
jgi:hypothetical protein